MADIHDIFRRGGKQLIDFLEYCVISRKMAPVFAFLLSEYRTQPTVEKALGLYDMFCAADAPARLDAAPVLPPRDLRIQQEILRIRDHIHQLEVLNALSPELPRRPATPAKYLFDFIVDHLGSCEDQPLGEIARRYDPNLTPLENLPGGKMSRAERLFVDRVWQPSVRPRLAAAGFRRIANVS